MKLLAPGGNQTLKIAFADVRFLFRCLRVAWVFELALFLADVVNVVFIPNGCLSYVNLSLTFRHLGLCDGLHRLDPLRLLPLFAPFR